LEGEKLSSVTFIKKTEIETKKP